MKNSSTSPRYGSTSDSPVDEDSSATVEQSAEAAGGQRPVASTTPEVAPDPPPEPAPQPGLSDYLPAEETVISEPVPPPLPDDGLFAPDFEEQDETLNADGSAPIRRSRGAPGPDPRDSPSYEDLHDAITERMPRPTGQPAAVRTYVRNFIQQHWGGPEEHKGKRIGDYEIISELGRGSMGAVFKARQVSLNREVALKMIISGQFASKANRIRFRREAEVSAELRHPNIVAIHDFGDFEGQPYYTMDFVEGQDMAAMVSERPLPWQNAAYYMHKVALAVAYAHERGIVHRDLKPQNILVDQFDEPRILDFGLARKMDLDSGVTMSSSVIGSPSYMPPEQALGQHNLVGPQSDVYGLGAILYELLTIRPPILAPTIAKTLEMVVNFEPIPPNRANPSIPDDLNTVVLKCLEKSVERRYQTATELADELGRVLDDRPILAKPIGIFEHAYRWCRRNRAIAAMIAVSMALMIGSSIISTSLWVKAELSLKQAEEQRKLAEAATLRAEESRKAAEKAQIHAEEEMQKAKLALEQVRAAEDLAAREGARAQTAEAGQQALELRLRRESVRAESAQREAEAFRQRAGLTDISQDMLMAMDRWGRSQPAEALGHLARQIRRDPKDWLAPALTLSTLTQSTWARPMTAPLPHENQGNVLGTRLNADKSWLATWTDQHYLNFWNTATGVSELRADLGKPIQEVVYSGDGAWALAALEGGDLMRVERGATSQASLLAQDLAGDAGALSLRSGGEQVAYRRANGAVGVIDAVDGTQVYEIARNSADGGGSPSLAYSPDGRLLLIGDGLNVTMLNAETGKPVAPPLKLPGVSNRVGFSGDGKRFYVMLAGNPPNRVEIRDTASGQAVGPGIQPMAGIVNFALNHSGSLAFVQQNDGTVSSWLTMIGQPVDERSQADAKNPVIALGASAYAFISKEEGLRVHNAMHTGHAAYFPVGERDALRIWLNDAGDRLVSVRPDQGVMLYDLTPNEVLPALLPHGGELADAIFSQDSRFVLSLGANGSVQFWRADTGTSLNKLPASENKITAAGIDPDGKVVVLGTDAGRVYVWDAQGSGQTRDLQESGPAIKAVRFSPDGSMLAAATKGATRYAWFVKSGERILLEEPDPAAINLRVGLAPTPQGGGMEEGGGGPMGGGGGRGGPGGRAPTLSDRMSMLSGSLRSPENYQANDLLFSMDGRYLATIAPLCVHVYNLETRQLVDFRYAITPEVGSPDFVGTVAAAAGEPFANELHNRMLRFYGEHPQDLRIWDMAIVKARTQSLDMDAIPSLTGFSRDGKLLYTGSDKSVRLWNTDSGKARTRALPLDATVTQATFDPQGRRLLTVTKGGRLTMFDTQYGLPLGVPWVVPGVVNHAEFSPDGQTILAAGKDGYVRLFEAPMPQDPAPPWLAQLAESVAGVQVDDEGMMTRAENLTEQRRQVQEAVLAGAGGKENLYSLYGNWLFLDPRDRAISPQSRMGLNEYVARALFISQPSELMRALEVAPNHEAVRLRLLEPQRWALHTEAFLHDGRTEDARECINTALLLVPADQRLLTLRSSLQGR